MAMSVGGHWREKGISLFNVGQSCTVAIISVLNIFLDLPYLMIAYLTFFLMSTIALWLHRETIKDISLEHQ
jgi:hypothetical protein